MCDATSAQYGMVGAQAGVGIGNAYGSYLQGKQNESYYNYLAKQGERQMEKIDEALEEQLDDITRAKIRSKKQLIQQGDQAKADQIVSMAANGVFSDSALGDMVLSDTEKRIEEDAEIISYNARLEEYRAKLQSLNQKSQVFADMTTNRIQGGNARSAANMQAANTLLTSGVNLGSGYLNVKSKSLSAEIEAAKAKKDKTTKKDK